MVVVWSSTIPAPLIRASSWSSLLQKDHATGRGDLGYEFLTRTLGGAVVAIESIKFPGHFVSFNQQGHAKVHKWTLEAPDVQFTIRVNVS